MAQRRNSKNPARREAKAAAESSNGKKVEGGAGGAGGAGKHSLFTWLVVLSLLGVWSSVAVVYFDILDYDSVLGKLKAYDADGDGDFDVEDAKVLLGLKDKTASGKETETSVDGEGTNQQAGNHQTTNQQDSDHETTNEHPEGEELREAKAAAEPPSTETAADILSPEETQDDDSGAPDVEFEIQAAVPLPAPAEDVFIPDDPRSDGSHLYDEPETIDSTGELVKEITPEQTAAMPGQDLTSSKLTQEEEPGAGEPSVPEAEPGAGEPSEKPGAGSEEQSRRPGVEPSPEPVPNPQSGSTGQEAAKKKKPKLFSKFDKTIKSEIDAAEKLRKKGKVEEALRAFESLVQQFPQSPRARFGKAQVEDDLAEKRRSNELLQKAIVTYGEASELPGATPDLIRATLKRRAERQQFLGRMRGALATLQKLVQMFPDDVRLKNDLGVSYLLLGDNQGAKGVYEEVLAVAPGDGFAKVHYGFILKSENKIAESIPYLREGLESGDDGTDDGRFYFHLGDALQRMGDNSAYQWYELGHKRGHFASVWQRSLYNVDGLKAQPWWTPQETGYTELVKTLERSWKTIREEALALMDQNTSLFLPEEENLRERGDWGQLTLWQQGRRVGDACSNTPKTCALLERYPEATGCKRGQIKFSVMQPGTHVWPHTGPTNCRLRMHLGLIIPPHGCRIRCTNHTREWEEGKVLIFDDSFEHEVWQEADSFRLIFIVDVWHPELTRYQRQTLSAI